MRLKPAARRIRGVSVKARGRFRERKRPPPRLTNLDLVHALAEAHPQFMVRAEEAFREGILGEIARRGEGGSIRPDLILFRIGGDIETAIEGVVAVWDLKTGDAMITQEWAEKTAARLGIPLEWIYTIRPD